MNCKHCNKKFSITEDENNLAGKLITCDHCNEKWIHKSNIDYLESLLNELELDLDQTEIQIQELNALYSTRIDKLEKNLEDKKEEVKKQNLLEKKINVFEKRITQTEKSNSLQAHLETKVYNMEREEKKLSNNILDKSTNIKKKTKYLEMKVNSYKNQTIKKDLMDEKLLKVSGDKNDVVNFNNYEKIETGKRTKNKFFWPNLTKPTNSK